MCFSTNSTQILKIHFKIPNYVIQNSYAIVKSRQFRTYTDLIILNKCQRIEIWTNFLRSFRALITAVAERSYREASWENIFQSSSWDAVESNEFKEDFARFKDGLQSWFSNLEQQGFEYSLPKTGVDDKNGKFHFKNLYSHNPNLFRWKGESDKWISWDELRNLFLINYFRLLIFINNL